MSKLFKIIEPLMLGVFFGFVPLYLCLIVAIFISSLLTGNDAIGPQVLWLLVPAVLIDIIFLKKWVKNA
jgi:uncharacterized protein (DUF2062 family)